MRIINIIISDRVGVGENINARVSMDPCSGDDDKMIERRRRRARG